MKKNLFAIAAAAFFLLSATGAGATGTDGGQSGNVNVGTNKVSVSITNLAFNTTNNVQSNTNKSVNENGNRSRNANANNNANTNSNTNQNDSRASASASASTDATANASGGGDGGSSTVNVKGDDTPASSAAAVYVTTSDDTCMGSSGVGGQGSLLGFSIGSTWTDPNCIMLKNARELMAQGYPKAAKMRLCMNEENAMAFELAGEPCPRQLASTQAALAQLRASEQADQEAAAVAKPTVQLASLEDSGDHAAASATRDDATAHPGDLLAMVASFAHHIATALEKAETPDDSSNPYPMDGLE